MPELSIEWVYWALMNGLPAMFATVMFLLVPPFDRLFAWNVEDRRSGIALGTGFLMRAGLFLHIIVLRNFGEVRWMLYGNTLYALILLGATLVHGDLFRWRRLVAMIWLYLYIEEPVWLLSLVPQAEAAWDTAGAALSGAPVGLFLKGVLLLEAVVLAVVGFSLYKPSWTTRIWPWKPDTVSSIVISGFPLSWAVWAVSLALVPSWPEARYGVLLNMLWLAGVGLSMFVFHRRFDLSLAATRRFAAVHLALLVLVGAGYLLQV